MIALSVADSLHALEQARQRMDHEDLIAGLGGWMPYTEGQRVFDADYPDGSRYYWTSLYMTELSDRALATLHRLGTDRPTPNSTLDVWTMGGAIQDADAKASAFPQRNATHMIAIEANWEMPSDDEACIAWARRAYGEMLPFSSGGTYLNFAGTREEQDEAVRDAYGPTLDRLRAVKNRYDPIGVFGNRGLASSVYSGR